MPILRKDGRKIYFAHVPKCAGSSLYNVLMAEGWHMANFGRPQGPLGTTGTAKMIREQFGITDLQKEGDYSGIVTSVQHVTADIWGKWGPFDSSFALIRHPIERFRSAYSYRYVTEVAKAKLKHSAAILAEFHSLMAEVFVKELPGAPHVLDNHFRPMLDFLLPDTKVYALEHGGIEQLRADLGLSGLLPHDKKSESYVDLSPEILEFVRQHYKDDIEWFEEMFPTA